MCSVCFLIDRLDEEGAGRTNTSICVLEAAVWLLEKALKKPVYVKTKFQPSGYGFFFMQQFHIDIKYRLHIVQLSQTK